MKALTVESYELLRGLTGPEADEDYQEHEEDILCDCVDKGLCTLRFEQDDEFEWWRAELTPTGERTLRIHEAFIGVRSLA